MCGSVLCTKFWWSQKFWRSRSFGGVGNFGGVGEKMPKIPRILNGVDGTLRDKSDMVEEGEDILDGLETMNVEDEGGDEKDKETKAEPTLQR